LSVTYISAELRRLVIARADSLCEYCLTQEEDTFVGCEVDNIVSEKHGGPTEAENLAYACLICNRNKGSDVGSFVPPLSNQRFVRFYNPRTDLWPDHFAMSEPDDVTICPLTEIGDVTARILDFNGSERLLERRALKEVGRYPTPEALRRMLRSDS
jgi:HNH endonuclease